MTTFIDNIKSNSIHIYAILIFATITIVYCFPILNGKKINQSDYKQFLGMSKEIVDYRDSTGKEALWTNSMFGGMPAYQISVYYPNNILVQIDKFLQLYLPRPVGTMFLYFLGFYILMLCLKINPHLSILGALAFGFSSYFFIILEAGHNTKAHAIAYMAPSVASLIYCFTNKLTYRWSNIIPFFFAFLCLGLHLRANHLQITYYLLFILGFFWIHYLIFFVKARAINQFVKKTILFFIAGLMAIAINLGNIWSTYEYSKYTIRGESELLQDSGEKKTGLDRDYATAWSYGKLETFNLLFPNFFGGSSHAKLSENSNVYQALRKNGISKRDSQNFIDAVPLYFGPQSFTSGPVYIGAVVWLLFFISLFTLKKPIKWIMLSLMLLCLMLAWGKYFPIITNFFLDYFPLYNKFRTVSMILVIVQFIIPVLGVLGLNYFLSDKLTNVSKKKILFQSSLILISISIFFLVCGNLILNFKGLADSQFPAWFVEALVLDRVHFFRSDIMRAIFFISIASITIYFLIDKYPNQKYKGIYILSILVLIDMWSVNKRYLNADDFDLKSNIEKPFQIEEFDKIIKQDTTIFRVYNLNERLDQGARTSYFHHSLGGYHGAKLGKYQEVIDMHLNKGNMNVINMLNTKYIIAPDQNRQSIVQKNPNALGNAWCVDTILWVKNANESINSLNNFNPNTTAILEKKYEKHIESLELNTRNDINLTEYSPNRLVYRLDSKVSSLAVFSEIFYPKGWSAYIDGVSVEHFPVNYILRALFIPKGAQEIVFEFKPKSFFISAKIAFFSSCLLIITALMTFGMLFFFKQ
ncbi:MAG: hypothetical protein CMP62_04240 [Flavobacteriales bacterium]|nr:hypothetical protein [Flavobacteriales bacterium]|tara:strand:- start:15414 stop:17843 length:2430 start_codon:yes stop_codon:yes gene_type:complete